MSPIPGSFSFDRKQLSKVFAGAGKLPNGFPTGSSQLSANAVPGPWAPFFAYRIIIF